MKMRLSLLLAFLTFSLILNAVDAGETAAVLVSDVVVEFARTVDIPARQSGPVAELNVKQNQWVGKGILIAKLDDTALVIRRRAAALRHDSARLVLHDNIEIQYAETALAEARSELEDSQAASDRVSGAVARNQLRRTKLATERAELELARAEKQRLQAEIDLHLRTADLAMIDHELRQLECVAPIDGIVLSVHRELGEWIHAGESLVTIADAGVLHVHALVDADVLEPAHCVGLPVSVNWSMLVKSESVRSENSLRGKVISVDPTRLPGNRFRLHAEVENRRRAATLESRPDPAPISNGWLLVPGMDVTMKIQL